MFFIFVFYDISIFQTPGVILAPGGHPSGRPHMTAFISLDGPPEQFGLEGANLHTWGEKLGSEFGFDVAKIQEALYKDPRTYARDALITITCPAAKDPDYQKRFPGENDDVKDPGLYKY
jgi:hypothetical protein